MMSKDYAMFLKSIISMIRDLQDNRGKYPQKISFESSEDITKYFSIGERSPISYLYFTVRNKECISYFDLPFERVGAFAKAFNSIDLLKKTFRQLEKSLTSKENKASELINMFYGNDKKGSRLYEPPKGE